MEQIIAKYAGVAISDKTSEMITADLKKAGIEGQVNVDLQTGSVTIATASSVHQFAMVFDKPSK